VAQFSATQTNGLAPMTVSFTDNSIGTITTRHWDFGDGSTSHTDLPNVVHTYSWWPSGDVSRDRRVTGSDSLLMNQVQVGLRAINDAVFRTNLTVRLIVEGPDGVSTNEKPGYIGLGVYPSGDVNASGTVTGNDSLLINQTMVGLRAYIVTEITPHSRSNNVPTPVTIYGVGFPTNSVPSVTIGPPVNLPLTNIVVVNREQITALVPAGGGLGTGTVSVIYATTNGVLSFGRFINQ
jgi:PKD repeat protein